MINIKYWRV